MKLVIHPRVSDEWLRRIHAVSPALRVVECESDADAEREVSTADAFYGTITPRLLRAARQLRWIQAPIAGLERYVFPELAEHPAVLTNMQGVYHDMVPEHAFLLMLALARGMRRYALLQHDRRWEPHEVGLLAGQTVGIVGLGGIGAGLARRAGASRCASSASIPTSIGCRGLPAWRRSCARPNSPSSSRGRTGWSFVPRTRRIPRRCSGEPSSAA